MPKLALDLDLLDLEVRNRRLQLRIPVDQPLVLVDQPGAVEIDEDLHNGLRQALVHREALAAPVSRATEALELVDDLAAGLGLPCPDLFDERLPPDRPPIRLLPLHHLPLDDHLGRDAGVVRARLPEHVAAEHPVVANQDVLERVVEGVAKVERSGDVRRRDDDGIRLGARCGVRAGAKDPGFLPERIDARFNRGRIECPVEHEDPKRPIFLEPAGS